MEACSREQLLLGKNTAGNMLLKYGSAYKREGACDECIAGAFQNMMVSVLPHGKIQFYRT